MRHSGLERGRPVDGSPARQFSTQRGKKVNEKDKEDLEKVGKVLALVGTVIAGAAGLSKKK